MTSDVQALHADVSNAGSLFQVASQFNLLEMVLPSTTPELGVGIYENDHTQGPACAIAAAGAGTISRNYFAAANGQLGQSEVNQIDCLADLGQVSGNSYGAVIEAVAINPGARVYEQSKSRSSTVAVPGELRLLLTHPCYRAGREPPYSASS
jgi:hypothetical protein